MKAEPTTTQLSTAATVTPAATTAQRIDLRTSAQAFFATVQWEGSPLDLTTETAASVLAWIK